MKSLLTILALACLILTAATQPQEEINVTTWPRVLTQREQAIAFAKNTPPPLPPLPSPPERVSLKAIKEIPIRKATTRIFPSGRGASYTNEYSLCPTNWMVVGFAWANAEMIRHSFIHNSNTGSFVIWWSGKVGVKYSVEWSDNGIFYPVDVVCIGGDSATGTYSNLWEHADPRCWLVRELKETKTP